MSTTPRTALAALARTAIEAGQALGVDIDSVLRQVHIDVDLVEERDGRVEVDALLALWSTIAEASRDPFFGLHVGERFVSAKTVHVVGFAARNSRTLGDCYDRTVRFGRLTNEGSEILLLEEGERARMRVGPLPGLPVWPRCYAEMAMSAYLTVGRNWTGEPFAPLGVAFQHPAPADISEYVRIFGPNVEFDAPKNELLLSASVLALPLREHDPALGDYLEARARVLLESLSAGESFENEVRSKIDAELANGAPSLDAVARRMGMSGRTLQRRLSTKGLSFVDLANDVRKNTALSLIKRDDLSVYEVAALSGYQDAPSFRAAFVRWTGMTPREYRRSARVDGVSSIGRARP